MARNLPPVQHFRGTTEKSNLYTGPEGELTGDITKKTFVYQDGATPGGHPLAKESRKISADGSVLTVNGGTEATLKDDIVLAVNITNLSDEVISTDAGSGLKVGADGKLSIDMPTIAKGLVATDDPLLKVDNDKVSTSFSLSYNAATGKFAVLGQDGTEAASVTVPAHTSMLQSAEIVTNPEGQQPGTYLKFVFLLSDGKTSEVYANVTSLVDIYTSGNGISISGRRVRVKIATGGGLAFDANGQLTVDLSSSTGGASGIVSGDSDNELKAGSDNKLYVEPYTAGVGLKRDDHTFSVKLAAEQPIYADGTGNIALSVGEGLSIVPPTGGEAHAKLVSSVNANNLISKDEGNLAKVGTDNGVFVQKYTAGDGVSIDEATGAISASLVAQDNQIQFVNGKLYIPTDYGTMD